jgi:transcriptional regulator with XRE-family HTH domain
MLQTGVYLDGDKLKFYRVIKNETHRSLAEKSGVSTGTIWTLEKRGRNERFHPNTLNKLSEALDIEPTELLGETDI